MSTALAEAPVAHFDVSHDFHKRLVANTLAEARHHSLMHLSLHLQSTVNYMVNDARQYGNMNRAYAVMMRQEADRIEVALAELRVIIGSNKPDKLS